MAHRPFGNVRRLKTGWQARYTGPDGCQHSGPYPFPTKTEARAWLAREQTAIRQGTWLDPRAGQTTFARYLPGWWEAKTALAASTRAQYELLIRKHLLPTFGHKQLASITAGDVRRWHDRLSAGDSPGPSTVAKAYRLLRHILSMAVEDQLIGRNPCQIRGASQDRPVEQKTPTLEEAVAVAGAIDERYRSMVLVAATCGLRFGELAGLQRKHVNPFRSEIRVEQQLSQVGATRKVNPPKTDAGRRTVIVPAPVLDELEKHLESYVETSPEAFVFTDSDGGWLDRNNFRKRIWLPAVNQTGVASFRFHDLRHLAATLAAESGVSLKSQMSRMGHASPRAALGYQHASQKHEDRIVAYVEEQVRAIPPPVSTAAH